MELWYKELQTPGLGIICRTRGTLHTEKTKFQDLAVLDTEHFGKMLLLDGIIQTTTEDEFVYHEMIAHVPLFTHKNPGKVLIIGGGDGGTVREVIKHSPVEKVILVEIDRRVVEVSKEYLPEISCALENEKVEVYFEDGIEYVRAHKREFDVAIIDSTDPTGAAAGLFEENFYKDVFEALKEDGIFTAQTESPFVNKVFIKTIFDRVKSIFPITRLYTGHIPTYPSGCWCFTMGSKKYDPLETDISKIPWIDTRYYSPKMHRASFVLPRFAMDLVL